MLNFSHMDCFLEASPALKADEKIHVTQIYIPLTVLLCNIFSSLYIHLGCHSEPVTHYPHCLVIHTWIKALKSLGRKEY